MTDADKALAIWTLFFIAAICFGGGVGLILLLEDHTKATRDE